MMLPEDADKEPEEEAGAQVEPEDAVPVEEPAADAEEELPPVVPFVPEREPEKPVGVIPSADDVRLHAAARLRRLFGP